MSSTKVVVILLMEKLRKRLVLAFLQSYLNWVFVISKSVELYLIEVRLVFESCCYSHESCPKSWAFHAIEPLGNFMGHCWCHCHATIPSPAAQDSALFNWLSPAIMIAAVQSSKFFLYEFLKLFMFWKVLEKRVFWYFC